MAGSATEFIQETYRQPYRPAALKRTAKKETADRDGSRDSYRTLILALAAKFTNSTEEAEAAAWEMFRDIRRYGEGRPRVKPLEDRLIARIALRRLLKFLE